MNLFDVLLVGLACYRLTCLVVEDEGPFSIFDRFRDWAGVYDVDQAGTPKTNIARGLSCPACVSIWTTPLVMLCWFVAPVVVWWLAVSGFVVVLKAGGK